MNNKQRATTFLILLFGPTIIKKYWPVILTILGAAVIIQLIAAAAYNSTH